MKPQSQNQTVNELAKIRNHFGQMYDNFDIPTKDLDLIHDFLTKVENNPNDYVIEGNFVFAENGSEKFMFDGSDWLFMEC